MKWLKVALNEKGYKEVDFYRRVNEKYPVEYYKISSFCRQFDRKYWKNEKLAKAMDEALHEMGVDW